LEVTSVGDNVLPSETTTEVTSNVLVRDGHTIVIGGLFRERTSAGRSQVPVLGNVPYLGTLFRRTADDTTREEVIVLVTPHVVKQDLDEAKGQQIMEDVERLRIGQRKGLRWWGRERLAQSHIRWAKQELLAGDLEKAEWNIDMALSLEPRMIEAIELKEKITDKAYWSETAQFSVVKYLVERLIMNDLGKPYRWIIPPERPLDDMKLDPEVRDRLLIHPEPTDPVPGLSEAKRSAELKAQQELADQDKGGPAAQGEGDAPKAD